MKSCQWSKKKGGGGGLKTVEDLYALPQARLSFLRKQVQLAERCVNTNCFGWLLRLILSSFEQLWQIHHEEAQALTAEQTLCGFHCSPLIGWDILEVASCSCADIHFTMTVWHIGLHVTGSVLLALSPKCPPWPLTLFSSTLQARLSFSTPNWRFFFSSPFPCFPTIACSYILQYRRLFFNWLVLSCGISSLFLSCGSFNHPDESAPSFASPLLMPYLPGLVLTSTPHYCTRNILPLSKSTCAAVENNHIFYKKNFNFKSLYCSWKKFEKEEQKKNFLIFMTRMNVFCVGEISS